jgi:hypothetical protein
MKNLQKMGGFAALYSGIALLVAMVGFLLVVGTLDVSELSWCWRSTSA